MKNLVSPINVFKVVEDRGCNIKYDHKSNLEFEEACVLCEELNLDPPVNGNDQPFLYSVVNMNEELSEADYWDGDESYNFLQ